MERVLKNQNFYVQVSVDRQDFGKASGFSAELLNLATNQKTALSLTFEELINSVSNPHTATVAATAPVGRTYINVQTGHNIADGDVIKDANDNMYYVIKVESDKIHVKQPLVAAIAANSSLTQVGNTGFYRAPVSIANTGKYVILVNNPAIDMFNYPISIEVVDHDEDTSTSAILASISSAQNAIITSITDNTNLVRNDIANQTTHIDGQFASTNAKIQEIANRTNFIVTV